MFDSGVGGLTVLHELLVSLPTEDYLYLGRHGAVPVRGPDAEELQAFSIEIADHLLARGRSCSSSRATPPARPRWGRSSEHIAARSGEST